MVSRPPSERPGVRRGFFWLVWLSGDHVLSIDVHVLDHTLGYYRLYRTLSPEQETSTIDVPIRIQIDWNRLAV